MFTNKSGGDAPSSSSATGARHTPFSLIGGDVVVTGSISASVDLHIDGRIDGDVSCATLVQGADSIIHGNLTAQTARIAGTVEGGVTADELVIERSARITGDCSYGSLTIAPGATVEGHFKPRSAAAPALKVVPSAVAAGGEGSLV